MKANELLPGSLSPDLLGILFFMQQASQQVETYAPLPQR